MAYSATVSFLAVAALVAQVARAETKPNLHNVVLQVVANPSAEGVALDQASLELEVRNWLKWASVTVIPAEGADPQKTHLLRIDTFTTRTEDGIYWSGTTLRCSLLCDQGISQNEPGKPQQVWLSRKIAAKKGLADFKNAVVRSLHGALLEITDDEFNTERPKRKFAPTYHGIYDGVPNFFFQWGGVVDVAVSEVKVRKQPPAPPYPTNAKEAGLQGTVVVEITIDPAGMPALAYALSGPAAFQMTAIRYALAWEFEPALVNGQPRGSRFKLSLPFKLK